MDQQLDSPAPQVIVLTGGAGFVGSHLAAAFLRDGHRVIVIDDLSSGRIENLPPGAELQQLDVRSSAAAELVRSSDATILCHQAAQMDVRASVADPCFDADVNIGGLLNLLEGGRKGKLRQVLFASSGGTVYGDQNSFPATEQHTTRPLCPYGVSKLASEQYLYYYHREHGIDAVLLRYANVYGPRQNPHGEAGVIAIFIDRLLRGEQCVIYGDGEQTRDYVYVDDVVLANRAALGRRGHHVFNVGTGVETSVNTLLARLRDLIPGPAPSYAAGRAGEQRRSSISARALQQELGTAPPSPLTTGLTATVSWFRDKKSTTTP